MTISGGGGDGRGVTGSQFQNVLSFEAWNHWILWDITWQQKQVFEANTRYFPISNQVAIVPKPNQNISTASSQHRAKIALVYRKNVHCRHLLLWLCCHPSATREKAMKHRFTGFQSRLGNSYWKHTVPVLTCGEDSLRRIPHGANLDFFTSQGSSVQLSLSRQNVIRGTWPAGSSDLCTFPVDLRVSPLSFLQPPWALIRAHFASGSRGIGGYHGTLLWR